MIKPFNFTHFTDLTKLLWSLANMVFQWGLLPRLGFASFCFLSALGSAPAQEIFNPSSYADRLPSSLSIEQESAVLLTDYLMKNISPASNEIKNPELKRIFDENYDELEKLDLLLEKIDQSSTSSEEEDFLFYFNQMLSKSSRITRKNALESKSLAEAGFSPSSIQSIELNPNILSHIIRKYRWTENRLPDSLKNKICSDLESLVKTRSDSTKALQLRSLKQFSSPLGITEEFYCELKDNQKVYLLEEVNKAIESLRDSGEEFALEEPPQVKAQVYDYQLIPNTSLQIDIDENIIFCEPDDQLRSAMNSVLVLFNILEEDQTWKANMSGLTVSYQKNPRSNCKTRHRFQGEIHRNTAITEESMKNVLKNYMAK